jgi:hypothetical protein
MTIPGEVQRHGQQLLAMILELRANWIILDSLVKCYGMFLFTGGVVPREPWGLAAMTSYLQRPFAADRISTAAVGQYQHGVEEVMKLGQAVTAGARPRTWRCRHNLAESFDRTAAEIRAVGNTLESALVKLVEGLKP